MEKNPVGSGLEMLREDENGAVWYDHDQQVYGVQWRDLTLHMAPAKFEAFQRLVGNPAPTGKAQMLVFPGGKK